MKIVGIILMIICPAISLLSQPANKIYTACRANPGSPVIDGRLDEEAWQKAPWGTGFTQRTPYEGEKPSQETAFKILYGNKNLYVGIRAYDTEPAKIERRMARRDSREGDWVEVIFDSYYDLRSGFAFSVNAAGVKNDAFMADDGESRDESWDPIWYVKTAADADGWCAEMKIPLNQLRFDRKEIQVWGLHVARFLHRKQEMSDWKLIPRQAYGYISRFGELHGLENIKPKRQVELLPYTVGKHQHFEAEEGNPFAAGRLSNIAGGLDGKIGITNNLTLDFTINPDFGQVEADPSEVNLTAFETFFQEKRPFFIEGRNILELYLSGGDTPYGNDRVFYSRRIGRWSQHEPETTDDEYIKMPENTTILAAFKLTGKTRNGLSIGILESLTAEERAEIDSAGERRHEAVEPMTNYFVLRLLKDFQKGKTTLGSMFTATLRDLKGEPQLNFLHRAAYTGGLDFFHNWKNKEWFLYANAIFSHVRGDEEAILNTQESSAHYFQRPDADHVDLDPDRTSLTGHGGCVYFGKVGGGRFQGVIGITWRSPGLELNDIGFLHMADRISQSTWLNYRVDEPFAIFRRVTITFEQVRDWDFSGANINDILKFYFHLEFKNYWYLDGGLSRVGDSLDTGALRGGPALKLPGLWNPWLQVQSDTRKKFHFTLGAGYFPGDDNTSDKKHYWGDFSFRPSNALSISIQPSFTINKQKMQYVETDEDAEAALKGEDPFLFASIDQKILAVTLRLDYSITPDLSIQFYGQPFISTAEYSEFKTITQPRAHGFNDRFRLYNENEITYDPEEEYYYVTEQGAGGRRYAFEDPAFKFLQFRSNLVIRWEYLPGSTLYLVWSQGRTDSFTLTDPDGFSFGSGMRDLFHLPPHDVFLIKFTYRFKI